MPSAEYSGRDLSAATLHSYLKDPTFVEYFNSFLLLPAFSSRVFYNADTGFFEQVLGEGLLGWMEGGVVSSSSQASLYLADELVGQSLDQQQSWLWVVQHRLPLFLRSDLYSEYKLCKLLTTTPPELRVQAFQLSKHAATKTSTPSLTKQPHTPAPQQSQGTLSPQEELDTITLPSLPVSPPSHGQRIPRRSSLTALPQGSSTQVRTHLHHDAGGWQNPGSNTPVAASKSDIELHSGARAKTGGRKFCHKRSSSVELPSTAVTYLEAQLPAEDKGLPSRMIPEILGTKSGMGAFWRFLRGTAGERNWLFWLDAERVKYYHKPIDQQRLLRELREHYLHAGAPLELPAESRSRLHMSRSSCLTLQQIGELQQALVQGLREYWCPRFILHHCPSTSSRTSHPHCSTAPAFFRSFSATPASLHTFTHSHPPRSHTDDTLPSNYTKLPPSLTPTQTPTFRRLASSRPRSKSSPTSYKKFQEAPQSLSSGNQLNYHSSRPQSYSNQGLPDIAMPLQIEDRVGMGMSQRPHTVDTASLQPPIRSRGQSRKVWDKQTEPSSPRKEGRSQSSMAHFNQLAKYAHHHLPDVNSRCASVLDSKDGPVCDSRCQIISVSGTPLHTLPSTPTPAPQGDVYTPLLYCLITEQRKAGGYFQQYLEQLEDKACLHCLLFWRDVQEYKSLFTAASFSPCEVERKAKALHSRYIMESGDEGIRCPQHMVGGITSHLWPAYEDLFDEAEEHALEILLGHWVELCNSEDFIFQKLDVVSRIPSPRSSRRVLTGDITGLEDLDEEELYPYEEDMAADILGSTFTPRSPSPTKYPFRPPSSRVNALHPLSGSPHTLTHSPSPLSGSVSQVHGQSRAVGLNDIMDNPTELEHFKIFLNEHCAAQDLMCWMEIEAFRGIPVGDKHVRDLQARQLRNKYFNKKYLFGPNSPASKDAQRQVVAAGGGGYGGRLPARPRTAVFREAQKHVRARLEKKWLAEFISTPEFIDRNGGSTVGGGNREASKSAKSSKAFAYEKSFANSHEAILFRRALQEEGTREPFQRYLCIKASPGTHPRENIQFWLEVQRYKVEHFPQPCFNQFLNEMYHVHTTEELLQQKVSAIVDCYLQSSVPPWLQLDIPQGIADQAVKKQQGPYIFREAQAAVFKNLYYNWQDYKNFISSYSEDEISSAISNFESQIIHLQTVSRERKVHSKPESLFMPRFETATEREERLKRERELAEFGKVAVAFRLSSPDPDNYTYYTELPAKFCTEEELLELREKKNKDGGDSGIGLQRHLPLSVAFKCSDSTDTETTPRYYSHIHSSNPACSSGVPSTSSKYTKHHIPHGRKPKKQPLVSSSRFLPHTAIRVTSGTQGSFT